MVLWVCNKRVGGFDLIFEWLNWIENMMRSKILYKRFMKIYDKCINKYKCGVVKQKSENITWSKRVLKMRVWKWKYKSWYGYWIAIVRLLNRTRTTTLRRNQPGGARGRRTLICTCSSHTLQGLTLPRCLKQMRNGTSHQGKEYHS